MITKTKIVCTIGPVSEDPAIFKKLYEAGMYDCRLNFSHGTYSDHERRFELIKETSNDLTVLVNLSSPKIRTGEVEDGTIIETGQNYRINADKDLIGNLEVCTIKEMKYLDFFSEKKFGGFS